MNLSIVARIYQLRHTLQISALRSWIAALPIHSGILKPLKPVTRKNH